uniref:ABC transporter domain-containing protein n=1 Tax=Aegilops tauschii subsp. strangulata TaxID=200361 RepID=A0A453MK93_AEGTS
RRRARLEGAQRLRPGRPPPRTRRQGLQRLRAARHPHRRHGPRPLRQIHPPPSHISSGRLRGAERMYGEVFVNGVKSPLPYGSYGYVDRDDVLIESLTVREMLYYSALLQLPGVFSSKKSFVEDAIAAMSLGDYADKLIGGHCFTKRLPTGERRRVSIARELVMRPHVLFIDEPLYHLDSVSALLLMVTLKKLASTGCTVIFTMYQSSTEVFGLFDRICLLSNGNTLFFGETLACLQHFSNAGFPCPIMQSPSDHFLRAINTDFDRIIAMCKNLQVSFGFILTSIFIFIFSPNFLENVLFL